MFANKEDLKNNIYNYQVDQITESDDSIVLQALNTAIIEAKSYLTGNDKKEYLDGRPRYDVAAIFAATGSARNAIILTHTLTIAKWYIIDLCNVDILYEKAKDRYDRAIAWLNKLRKGEVNIDDLPQINTDTPTDTDDVFPFSFGSRQKFNHE
ncbi:phage gp36-like protein [Chryseobacterium sp. 52]|uniref:phage protein Gp36 family protein n=1 Tax=Chryseobacterium sp. 52 TaxID=2035213 RepID=UPI000C17D720|nr:phage protein Gp36 family protein [Chryseobacterium sp. 52]PIF44912.1 phage gp36-like protein [Chryseobacterium sp. 52]